MQHDKECKLPLLDTYRRNVIRKREEIAKLQDDKAKEQKKTATLTAKINSASQAISKTKNANTIKTKLNEIQRYQKGQAIIEKKIAEIDKKIARKQRDLSDVQKKVSKEEQKETKKRNTASKKQAREQSLRMKKMNEVIVKHDSMHKNTQKALERLQNLPERIVVLFLAANPVDQVQLRLDEEARSINDMIRKAEHRESVQFETRWAVQPMDVLQAINELNPTVVHFSGHGSDEDEIVFQNPNGTTKLVSMEAIVQTMMASSDSIRLVFFNTCHSYNQARAVVQYVEAAIGVKTSIGDDAAKVFASQFYSAISFGVSLQKAFDQAKALFMMEGIPEETMPELFIQDGYSSDEIVIVRPQLDD